MLGGFQFGSITHRAVVNILVCLLVAVIAGFCGSVRGNGIAGSHGAHVLREQSAKSFSKWSVTH